MNFKGLTLVLAGFLLFSPTTVLSGEIDVRAGNVRASTRNDGSIYVNSGNTKVEVPARHSVSRWYPWGFFRFPWRTNCQTTSNRSYQRQTQVANSGHSVVESSVYTSNCR